MCGRLECVVREAAPAVCHWVSCGGGGGWLGAASVTGAAFCVVGALLGATLYIHTPRWHIHCVEETHTTVYIPYTL